MTYAMIVAGAFIMGFAIKNIYDPVNLVTGGVSGVAIMLKDLFAIPLWLSNTLLNIPLFLAGYKLKSKTFIVRTLAATIALSVSLYLIPEIQVIPQGDLFLPALFGGILTGAGIALVFLCQATTGGTDLLASMIQKKFPHYTLPQILQVIDAAIVLAGAVVFGIQYALYALVAIYAVSKVSDDLIEGLKYSKAVFIISEQNQVIADSIMHEMERGVTGIEATGMYSGKNKKMLYCVVAKKEIVRLKEIAQRHDEKAFVIVTDAREVLGEGFIEY